jgi:hypothetical protein
MTAALRANRAGAPYRRALGSLLGLIAALVVATVPYSMAAAPGLGKATETPGAVTSFDAQGIEAVGQIGGSINVVRVRDGRAYIGVGPRLVALDVSNPRLPRQLSQSAPLPSVVQDLSLDGPWLYVASDYGLHVYVLEDPNTPREVGSLATEHRARRVEAAGDYVYLSYDLLGRGVGTQLIDVSDRRNPRPTDRNIPGAMKVALDGSLLYAVATLRYTGILWVFDVSDPLNPIRLSSTPIGGGADVAVLGDRLYSVSPFSGSIVDVGDPSNPTIAGRFVSGQSVAATPDLVYILGANTSFSIIDSRGEPSDSVVGHIPSPDLIRASQGTVAISGSTAFLATGRFTALKSIDVSDPTQPHEVGEFETAPGGRVAARDGIAAVQGTAGDVHILDVSSPVQPRRLAKVSLDPGTGRAVAVGLALDRRYIYAAIAGAPAAQDPRNRGGLAVIDIADPAHPYIAGEYRGFYARGIAVASDYAFLVAGDGVHIMDITQRSNPREIGSYDADFARVRDAGIALQGAHAYVVADMGRGSTSLLILNVQDPFHPFLVGRADIPGAFAVRVAVSGPRVFVADGNSRSGGLWIFDVSNQAEPVQVGFFPAPWTQSVSIEGRLAYLTTCGLAGSDPDLPNTLCGLRIVDVADPSSPVELAQRPLRGTPYQLSTASNGIALSSVGEAGVWLSWLSEP